MTGHRRRILWVAALAAAFLVPGVPQAGAHTHPTPIERSAPAVVYVEARAQVEVALVEHRQSDPTGIHIAILDSTSNPVLAAASGFVVDPTGVIVTSGAITRTDLDRASIYAVNEAFRKHYGRAAPLTGDLFTRQRIGPDTNLLQQRLTACYPPYRTNDAGGCHVMVMPTYVVYPYVTSQQKYGHWDAELLPASTPDVALLRVRGGTSVPTVALGESTAGARALSVLGFTGIPAGDKPVPSIDAHLAAVGGSALKTAGLTAEETATAVRLAGGLKAGMRGGPVLDEQGEVIGFLVPEAGYGPPPAAPGRLVGVGAIRAVLAKEGVTPRRGPVDSSFDAAMHAFKNGGFAAAVPGFKAALAVFPGHAMAARNLAVAEKNIASGTPGVAPPAQAGQPITGSAARGTSFPWTVVPLTAAAVLLLAAAAVLVLRQRRQTGSGAGPTPAPVPPRPKEGQSAVPSRSADGGRERQAVPSTGSGHGAFAVIERGGSGRGGPAPPSRTGTTTAGAAPHGSIPAAARASAHGDGPSRAPRAPATPPSVPSSRREASEPAPAGGLAFCTQCGAHLAPHHRYCGRCGGAAG